MTDMPVAIPGIRLVEKIAEGGMGVVYKAHQESLDRFVAVKVLYRELAGDDAEVKRFISEARAAARLTHAGIVQVYDAGETDGTCFFIMELVEGETLTEFIRHKGCLPARNAVKIAISIAEALRHAWTQENIVHLDIKPGNILMGGDGEVKVADLGLSRRVDGAHREGADAGEYISFTPNYCSPEQATGGESLDVRSDIYSLGATLYTALTGHVPFADEVSDGATLAQVEGHLPDPRTLAPDVSAACSAAVRKMMAKKRGHRQRDWDEVLVDLRRTLANKPPRHPLLSTVDSTVLLHGADTKTGRTAPNAGQGRGITLQRGTRGAGKARTRSKARRVRGRTGASRRRPNSASSIAAWSAVGVAVLLVAAMAVGSRWRRQRAAIRADAQAQSLYEKAMSYARLNPRPIDALVSRFKQVETKTRGTRYSAMAAAEAKRLLEEKERAISDARAELKDRVASLMRRERFEEATALCRNATGPYAAELKDDRTSLLDRIRREEQLRAEKNRLSTVDATTEAPPPATVPAPEAAGEEQESGGELAALRQQRLDAETNVDAEHTASVERSAASYLSALSRIGNAAKAEGDLDGVMQAEAEAGRFKKENGVPNDLKPSPAPEIARLQENYRKWHAGALASRDEKRTAILAGYGKALANLRRRLVVAGDIESARDVQKELEVLEPRIAALKAELAARARSEQPPKVASAQPAGSSAASKLRTLSNRGRDPTHVKLEDARGDSRIKGAYDIVRAEIKSLANNTIEARFEVDGDPAEAGRGLTYSLLVEIDGGGSAGPRPRPSADFAVRCNRDGGRGQPVYEPDVAEFSEAAKAAGVSGTCSVTGTTIVVTAQSAVLARADSVGVAVVSLRRGVNYHDWSPDTGFKKLKIFKALRPPGS